MSILVFGLLKRLLKAPKLGTKILINFAVYVSFKTKNILVKVSAHFIFQNRQKLSVFIYES